MAIPCAAIYKQHFRVSIWVLASVILFHSQISGVQGSNSGQQSSSHPSRSPYCRLSTRHYYPGEVWYPTSRTSIGDYCIRCTCLSTGKLNCTKERCPPDCSSPAARLNPCCKACTSNSDIEDSTQTSPITGESSHHEATEAIETSGRVNAAITRAEYQPKSSLSGPNLESSSSNEDMEDDHESTENPELISCLHQGKIYNNGDTFMANVTGLPIASVDQCMQCQCQHGMVLCAMKACSTFECGLSGFSGGSGTSSWSTSIGDTCCQRCAVWKGTKIHKPSTGNGNPPSARKPSPNPVHNSQDKTPGFLGTSGNTNNGGLLDSSPMTLESSVSFRDVTSINNALGTGKESRKPVDDCISSGRFYLHGSTWHPIIGPFGTMECVTCKCNHGQIECSRLKCPARRELSCSKPIKVEGHCCPICASQVEQVVDEGTTMCVSGKQDITVFKSFGTGLNGTELIEFAFLRPKKLIGSPESQIERHEWKLKDSDIEEFITQYLSTSQFDNLNNRNSFVLLGATNEKNVEKFTRREKKLEKRCTSRCSVRISSLERSLRLHKLISRTQCLAFERTVSTV